MAKTRQSLEDLAARALGALGNKTRLRIFRLLNRAGRDGLIIGEVHRHIGTPQRVLKIGTKAPSLLCTKTNTTMSICTGK